MNKLKEKKVSKWKQRLTIKEGSRGATVEPSLLLEPKSEAEKIHQENLDKISQMTSEEIEQEQAELLSGLYPNLIKSLFVKDPKEKEKSNESCCNDGHDEHVHADRI